MNFEGLKSRVERTERLMQGRVEQTRTRASAFKQTWRESWTPMRIIVIGLASGFLVGRAEPARAIKKVGQLGGPKWIQLISAVSGLLGSLQAAVAAATAKDAAETADRAADNAGDAVDAATGDASATADMSGDDASEDGSNAASTDVPKAMPPSDRRRRPEPAWDTAPRPAEAATEMSER